MSGSGVNGVSGPGDADALPGDADALSIVLAGGGTAGHIEPAMAVADALIALDPALRITALGTARGLESRLVPDRGYPLRLVSAVPLPRRLNADLFRLPWRVRAAVDQCRTMAGPVAGIVRPLS